MINNNFMSSCLFYSIKNNLKISHIILKLSSMERIERIESNESNESNETNIENVTFGNDTENITDNLNDDYIDPKYTVVDADHLDEDKPIPGQEYCLFSFMSPEGVMNCDVRAFKFRGAFPTLEKALEYAKNTLEKNDKYFKIFAGETGKWLEFDPPVNRVEKEMTSNDDHQKIIEAQSKQRMEKLNQLAGKHKQIIDKKEQGKGERIDEYKKAGAANDAVEKHSKKNTNNNTNNNTDNAKTTDNVSQTVNSRSKSLEATKERLRKRLAEKQNKEKLQNSDVASTSNALLSIDESNITNNVNVVNKNNMKADENIEKIRKLMNDRKTKN